MRDGFTGRLESWSMTFPGPAPAVSPGPPPIDGTYRIRFSQTTPPNAPLDRGCLSAEGNATGHVASIDVVGPAPFSCNVPAGSVKDLWEVYPLTSSTGQVAHVIKSRTNDRCLIRGQNGTAGNPSLYSSGVIRGSVGSPPPMR